MSKIKLWKNKYIHNIYIKYIFNSCIILLISFFISYNNFLIEI